MELTVIKTQTGGAVAKLILTDSEAQIHGGKLISEKNLLWILFRVWNRKDFEKRLEGFTVQLLIQIENKFIKVEKRGVHSL